MLERKQMTIGELECVTVRNPSCVQPRLVVVLCHGFGAPGTDLVGIANELIANWPALNNAEFVFPAAPLSLDPMFDSRAWWMIDIERVQRLMARGEFRELEQDSPDLLPTRRQQLTQLIDELRAQYGLAANQVVIGGFSQGSMLTTDVALHYPEPLGGLIIWSGALINAAVWREQAEQQRSLEVVQSHGSLDPILPLFNARDLSQMLADSGHRTLMIEFSGPHTIPGQAIEAAGELMTKVMERSGQRDASNG